jgi:trans-aconitate methyltransferase
MTRYREWAPGSRASHKYIPDVTGLDADPDVLESVVASVATLHHLPDLTQTLTRLSDLVAPGGVLAAVGLARSTRPSDALYDLAGVVQQQQYKRLYGIWAHSAPIVWTLIWNKPAI